MRYFGRLLLVSLFGYAEEARRCNGPSLSLARRPLCLPTPALHGRRGHCPRILVFTQHETREFLIRREPVTDQPRVLEVNRSFTDGASAERCRNTNQYFTLLSPWVGFFTYLLGARGSGFLAPGAPPVFVTQYTGTAYILRVRS